MAFGVHEQITASTIDFTNRTLLEVFIPLTLRGLF